MKPCETVSLLSYVARKSPPHRGGLFLVYGAWGTCDLQARSALRRHSRRMLPQGDQGEALSQVACSNHVGHTKKKSPHRGGFFLLRRRKIRTCDQCRRHFEPGHARAEKRRMSAACSGHPHVRIMSGPKICVLRFSTWAASVPSSDPSNTRAGRQGRTWQ